MQIGIHNTSTESAPSTSHLAHFNGSTVTIFLCLHLVETLLRPLGYLANCILLTYIHPCITEPHGIPSASSELPSATFLVRSFWVLWMPCLIDISPPLHCALLNFYLCNYKHHLLVSQWTEALCSPFHFLSLSRLCSTGDLGLLVCLPALWMDIFSIVVL